MICIASAVAGLDEPVGISVLVLGLAGYIVSVFFAYRLYRSMKKNK